MGAGSFRQVLAILGARLGGGVGVMPTPLHTPTLKELISSQHVQGGRAGKASSVPIPTIKQEKLVICCCMMQFDRC